MTELQFKSSHISVKARAREINAEAALKSSPWNCPSTAASVNGQWKSGCSVKSASTDSLSKECNQISLPEGKIHGNYGSSNSVDKQVSVFHTYINSNNKTNESSEEPSYLVTCTLQINNPEKDSSKNSVAISPLDEILVTLEKICEEFKSVGWSEENALLLANEGDHRNEGFVAAKETNDDTELEKVRAILAGLDFSKYRRRKQVEGIMDKTKFSSTAPSSPNLSPFTITRSSSFSQVGQSSLSVDSALDSDEHRKEKRKRKKGPASQPERSLTYPPQRKLVLSEEEFGLRSLKFSMCQPSDISLADSHLCPSEDVETYQDVVESVVQRLTVEDRAGKALKKKHHSDPGGDKAAFPELIAASKSEPELGDDISPRVTLQLSHPSQEHRKYSKRRLRGPYGEMLEEEMKKSFEKQKSYCSDLGLLQDICPHQTLNTQSVDDCVINNSMPKRKTSANYPLVNEDLFSIQGKVEEITRESMKPVRDTRTHVVGELYDTEKSYVESLQILVNKYMCPLKSSEYCSVVDSSIVDEIFFQIPEILSHHETFLDVLKQRLSNWDSKQKVGDIFVEAFAKQPVIDTYTAFINNWKSAKDAIKLAIQAKPAFAKFLEHTSREHKGKLSLDALLIMPVQRIPRYELLLKELIKHTHVDHPDHQILVLAQKEVHELAVKINRMEREAYKHEQMQQKVKEIEHLIEGVMDLVQPDRIFIQYDLVNILGSLGYKKERCLFLFSDLLLITSIKRKSGTIRKASSSLSTPSDFSSLDMNKYKLLMRFSLDNLDVSKSSDVNSKKLLKEIENLEEDVALLSQITELTTQLNCQHQGVDDAVKDLLSNVTKQLSEKQNVDTQLLSLELTVTTQEGIENLTIIYPSPDKRTSWETAFTDAKQKLALSTDRRPPPEFMHPLPIRKTRAGLQFACASATLGLNSSGMRDVWICNSDGYVGQVCILSLQPEPTVTSCNGVCNARILSIASIPAACSQYQVMPRRQSVITENALEISAEIEKELDADHRASNGNIKLDSDSSEEEDYNDVENDNKEKDLPQQFTNCLLTRDESQEEIDNCLPTVWLGTEDGCIHVYNSTDNIRIKKNKIKIQHSASVQCIIYLDSRVFVSLANGELFIYKKDFEGGWNTNESHKVQIGSSAAPVTKMLAVAGKLWCGCQNFISVLNTTTLTVETSFQVSCDLSRAVLCMVTSGLGVWIAIQQSAVIRLFHATTYECLLDVNIAPAVSKMLSGCDDIIRQHKAACLRITSLLACKDLLWVGTSAGVILTLPLPHLTSTTNRLDTVPNVSGIPHGHTGHVRFLTCVEMNPCVSVEISGTTKYGYRSLRNKDSLSSRRTSTTTVSGCKLLVISGGDGYEDFRNCGLSEAVGRDDSTNHLLLWQV